MKVFNKLLFGAAALLTLSVAGGYAWMQGSTPQLDGRVELDGLSGAVVVARDVRGVAHIVGADRLDVARGGW